MSDVLSKDQRRLCMSRNRSRDTKPEVVLRKACWSVGLRYRLKAKLPGRPDFVFVGERVAVFVDGCFWHGCPDHYKAPATDAIYWREKRKSNWERDRQVEAELAATGWYFVRVWEHEVKRELPDAVATIMDACLGSRAARSMNVGQAQMRSTRVRAQKR